MTIQDLRQKLKEHRGSIKRVAERSGMHIQSVREVLTGRWHNQNIVFAATEILLECEQEKAENKEKSDRIQKALEALQAA